MRAFGIAVLKRSEAAAVQRDVGIGRVGIETLTDHDDGFAMFVDAASNEGDVSVEGDVAGDFFFIRSGKRRRRATCFLRRR